MQTYWILPRGVADNPGTREAPMGTLDQALDHFEKLNEKTDLCFRFDERITPATVTPIDYVREVVISESCSRRIALNNNKIRFVTYVGGFTNELGDFKIQSCDENKISQPALDLRPHNCISIERSACNDPTALKRTGHCAYIEIVTGLTRGQRRLIMRNDTSTFFLASLFNPAPKPGDFARLVRSSVIFVPTKEVNFIG